MECFSVKDKGQDGGVGFTNIWLVSTKSSMKEQPQLESIFVNQLISYTSKPTIQHILH